MHTQVTLSELQNAPAGGYVGKSTFGDMSSKRRLAELEPNRMRLPPHRDNSASARHFALLEPVASLPWISVNEQSLASIQTLALSATRRAMEQMAQDCECLLQGQAPEWDLPVSEQGMRQLAQAAQAGESSLLEEVNAGYAETALEALNFEGELGVAIQPNGDELAVTVRNNVGWEVPPSLSPGQWALLSALAERAGVIGIFDARDYELGMFDDESREATIALLDKAETAHAEGDTDEKVLEELHEESWDVCPGLAEFISQENIAAARDILDEHQRWRQANKKLMPAAIRALPSSWTTADRKLLREALKHETAWHQFEAAGLTWGEEFSDVAGASWWTPATEPLMQSAWINAMEAGEVIGWAFLCDPSALRPLGLVLGRMDNARALLHRLVLDWWEEAGGPPEYQEQTGVKYP